jgi:hypothetical protein
MSASIIGYRFGRWSVLWESVENPHRFMCRCDCGIERLVYKYDLVSGKSTACGCTRKKPKPIKTPHARFHRMSNTPVWNIWRGMIQRCRDHNQENYKNYGARGITVCERWNKFQNFFSDMGSSWSEGLEIERKNGLLGYSPENCVWATRIQQMNNMSRNVSLEFRGKTQTVANWARELKIGCSTIHARLRTLGWTVEQALTVRPRYGNRLNV